MLLNIGIALILFMLTTVTHAIAMILAMQVVMSQRVQKKKRLTRIFWVSSIVILMFLASFLEVSVWAFTYLSLEAVQGLEKALYFSMVTFTTLGYGEIVLDAQWRLLASFEAVNGILMFGWSTAVVIAVVQRLYFDEIMKYSHNPEHGKKEEALVGPGGQ